MWRAFTSAEWGALGREQRTGRKRTTSQELNVCLPVLLQVSEPNMQVFSGSFSDLPCGPHTYRLEDLAYTRSGDKGDSANIGENF